jgi:hypothetical protein
VGARGFWTFFAGLALVALVAVAVAGHGSSSGAAPAGADPTAPAAALAATTTAPATTVTTATTVPATTAPATTVPATTVPPTTVPPTTTTAAFAPTDDRVTIFGDSVILGTQYSLPGGMPGWDVDLQAAVGRFVHQLVPVVRAAAPHLGEAAVVQIGNNYNGDEAAYAADLDQVLTSLDHLGRVVLLTVAEIDDQRLEVNTEVRAAAARHPNVVLVDWQAALVQAKAAGGPRLVSRDGLHLTKAGADTMTSLLTGALGPAPAAP